MTSTVPWSSHVVHLPSDPAASVSNVAISGTDSTGDPHPAPSDEDYTTSLARVSLEGLAGKRQIESVTVSLEGLSGKKD